MKVFTPWELTHTCLSGVLVVKLLPENHRCPHRVLAVLQPGGLDYNVFIIDFMQKFHLFYFPSPCQMTLGEMPKALYQMSGELFLSKLFCLPGTVPRDRSMAHMPSASSSLCSKFTISMRPFLTPHLPLPPHFLSLLLCALFSFSVFLTLL